jgi:hypothetical protein
MQTEDVRHDPVRQTLSRPRNDLDRLPIVPDVEALEHLSEDQAALIESLRSGEPLGEHSRAAAPSSISLSLAPVSA